MIHPLLKNRITITISELAQWSGLSEQTWKRKIKANEIEAIQDKKILILTTEVERYFKSKTKKLILQRSDFSKAIRQHEYHDRF